MFFLHFSTFSQKFWDEIGMKIDIGLSGDNVKLAKQHVVCSMHKEA